MKKIIFSLAALLLLISCGASRHVNTVERPAGLNLSLGIIREPRANQFINLDYGVRLHVYDARGGKAIMKRYDANPIFVPEVNTYPEVKVFAQDNIKRYMRELGFNMESDVDTDYMLTVNLSEFNLDFISGIGWNANVSMNVDVSAPSGQKVYPNVVVKGMASQMGDANDYDMANRVMNTAWTNALEDIDWAKIASFMKVAKHASDEKNKKVKGDGDTALEHQVILWSIYSSPKGADVNWRVISSTPEVKNTNKKYLGTTPFESTETLDIIGLTYNTAGNVQIEVSCEKNGYLLQTKRFNLRSVIDAKEISTKFNLVKEDE